MIRSLTVFFFGALKPQPTNLSAAVELMERLVSDVGCVECDVKQTIYLQNQKKNIFSS